MCTYIMIIMYIYIYMYGNILNYMEIHGNIICVFRLGNSSWISVSLIVCFSASPCFFAFLLL